MTTKTPAKTPDDHTSVELTATDIFPLLAVDRRRHILHYLAQRTGSVPLGELAEQVALWEDVPTYDQYERILTSFHHQHLPTLREAGILTYDVEQETVTVLPAIDDIRPYLDLALSDDHA